MLQPNELRIGNIVKDDIQPGGTIIITATFLTHVEAYADPMYNGKPLQPKISGIPLTPEILERCGFEKDSDKDDFHECPLWRHSSTHYLYCEAGYFVDNSGHYGHYCDMGDIKYLHQLQNFYFALTGRELEIKKIDII